MTRYATGRSSWLTLTRLGFLGTVMSAALLLGFAQFVSGQDTAVKRGNSNSDGTFAHRIVRASQAITKVRVGECLDERGRRPEERNRIEWNNEFTSKPQLHAGGHFVVIEQKEKPKIIKSDLGNYFEKEVLSPSIEVGLDMLPEARQVNGKKVSGRIWASYRGLEIKSEIGFPQWKQFGLFGDTFIASDYWGPEKDRRDLTPEDLARLTPCQVLTRATLKKEDVSRNFFSLPIDMSTDGDIEEFCNVNFKHIKRVWSTFQGPQGENWLMWCRLDPSKTAVTIRQCVVEDTLGGDGTFWTWKRKSPVESVTRKIGTRHTVSNLSFAITYIFAPEQNPRTAWVHIADPELATSDSGK